MTQNLLHARSATAVRRHWPLLLLFGLVLILAAWLRLDQVRIQTLDGDEWHAVHQLTYYPMSRVMLTYGFADYGIPVVLYYKLLSLLGGVSELRMRLPMLACGLLTVIALPWFFRRHFPQRVLWVFALLLALSPVLIDYSRLARTYALTLLGCYVAFHFLARSVRGSQIESKGAALYAVTAGLVVWAHAVTGPMLIAPLVVLWMHRLLAMRMPGWLDQTTPPPDWRPLIRVTLWTGMAMSLAVLPPLLGDPEALTKKSGMDQPGLDTWWGLLHLWSGTGSTVVALIALVLALVGARSALRAGPMSAWLMVGTALTYAALVVAKPWWSQMPLALSRYLLPALPLFLLAVAVGANKLLDLALPSTIQIGARAVIGLMLAAGAMAAWWLTSPIPDWLSRPNSYTHHYYFAGDYRNDHNLLRQRMPELPNSPYWKTLSALPRGSAVIATAPTYWSTFAPMGPLWEAWSGQRVIPAFVWGACETTRHGEVPDDSRFRLRNAVHLNSVQAMEQKSVTHVAYYLAPEGAELLPRLRHCEDWVRKQFGPPDHEDKYLLVWHFATIKSRINRP